MYQRAFQLSLGEIQRALARQVHDELLLRQLAKAIALHVASTIDGSNNESRKKNNQKSSSSNNSGEFGARPVLTGIRVDPQYGTLG